MAEKATFIRCLVITSNIGSLFEVPTLIPGWCKEVSAVIKKVQPDFIEFTFQEIGGKDSAFMNSLSEFEKLFTSFIINGSGVKLYCSGLLFEDELQSPNFTALASLFLLNSKAKQNLTVWDFQSSSWNKFEYNTEQKFAIPIANAPFTKHFRFEGTKSRKGFLQTKWKIMDESISFINIHMYHDDKNTSAVAKIPSEYSIKREEALSEMVRKCGLTNDELAIISGDYNIRLDGDVIHWLNNKFSHRHLTETKIDFDPVTEQSPKISRPVTVQEKNFLFNYSSEVFCGPIMRPKLQKFDREIDRFNKNHTECILNEMDINFDPTYCFGDGSLENGETKVYATKRIPAWCDRVTFSKKTQQLLKQPYYDAIYGKYNTGDHCPVYLAFSLGNVPDEPAKYEIEDQVLLKPHNFKLKYFKKLTFCQKCQGFIWGVTSPQGYQCTACKYAVHKKDKCKNFVPNNCGARLRTPTLEQVELAEKLAKSGITDLGGSISFSRFTSESAENLKNSNDESE